MHVQAKIGSFCVGKQFDALLVDTGVGGNIDVWAKDTLEARFEKFINLGDDRNIQCVWVQGRQVAGSMPAKFEGMMAGPGSS